MGYAFHSGEMVNGNAPADTTAECLNQCNNEPECKFWEFGDDYCRLRSNDGNGAEVAESYVSGPKFCFLKGRILFYNISETSIETNCTFYINF